MDQFPVMGVPDTGDTAWMLASAALVLLMTPGLAFFYGGMVRARGRAQHDHDEHQRHGCRHGAVGALRLFDGLRQRQVGNLFGDPSQYFGLKGLIGGNAVTEVVADPTAGIEAVAEVGIPLAGTIPQTVFVAFQLMFAIITVALISGAIADRLKFGGWLVFAGLWATFVYFPVAHWVFAFDGCHRRRRVAGSPTSSRPSTSPAAPRCTSTPVSAGLVLALILGKRLGWPGTPMRPHNLPFVMLGAGLLWFGWYGFNAGSAIGAGGIAGTTFVTTTVATAAAMLGWLLTERIRDGHATSLGAASGVVAGLVAITPSCSSVNVVGALAIGVGAGVLCALAVGLKFKFGFDDSLDVVGVHLVGGLFGTLMVGLVATAGSARRQSTACSTAAAPISCGDRPSAPSLFWVTRPSSRLSWPCS